MLEAPEMDGMAVVPPRQEPPEVRGIQSCKNAPLGNSVRGAGELRRVSAPGDRPVFGKNEAGFLVSSDQQAAMEIADGQTFVRFPATRGGVSSGCADCS